MKEAENLIRFNLETHLQQLKDYLINILVELGFKEINPDSFSDIGIDV